MKVAIIEDSLTMVSLWKNFLKETEHRNEIFSSDPEIVKQIEAFAPDIVICQGVPLRQSPEKIVAALKGNPLHSAPLIIATSLEDREIKESWDFKSVDGVLIKPFTRSRVLALLDRFQTRKSLSERKQPLAAIVDDSQIARSVLAAKMRELGFTVETANDGQAGLELIERLLPDIALVDIQMPGKSGLDICAELATGSRTGEIPIIVISATINDGEMRRGFHCGAIDFLPKPVSSSLLAQTVFTVMGRREIPQRGRALILENDVTASSIIVKLLEESGVNPEICSSIEELRNYLTISIPDFISISLPLFTGDGLNLCRSLRDDERLKNVPLVVMASVDRRDLMVQCLRSGANDFIEKPFIKEEFQARIENLLKIKRLQDELIQKNRVLENLAYQDPLTGLLNRRYLGGGIQREISRAKRNNEPLSVIMIDLDLFKQVNDSYGHEAGDQVLREVSAIIRSDLRGIDIPCRYGGEEICLVLPGCSLENAKKIAERLRKNCENARFSDHAIRQTLSLGVAAFPPFDVDKLIDCADKALYQAKARGRNCVVIYCNDLKMRT